MPVRGRLATRGHCAPVLPGKNAGPVVGCVPFQHGRIDVSHNALEERLEWDHWCDVRLLTCGHRSRMIEAWRQQVPTAQITSDSEPSHAAVPPLESGPRYYYL